MADKQPTAFVTTKKGVCYLTVKIGRQNFHIMRIRNYTIDAQDKRDMRRLHPDTVFDWKKIAARHAFRGVNRSKVRAPRIIIQF